jgi:hypothetical protein
MFPAADRVYADRQTQAAFDAWSAGKTDTSGAAVSLIDAALHFSTDARAVKCLNRALAILTAQACRGLAEHKRKKDSAEVEVENFDCMVPRARTPGLERRAYGGLAT